MSYHYPRFHPLPRSHLFPRHPRPFLRCSLSPPSFLLPFFQPPWLHDTRIMLWISHSAVFLCFLYLMNRAHFPACDFLFIGYVSYSEISWLKSNTCANVYTLIIIYSLSIISLYHNMWKNKTCENVLFELQIQFTPAIYYYYVLYGIKSKHTQL